MSSHYSRLSPASLLSSSCSLQPLLSPSARSAHPSSSSSRRPARRRVVGIVHRGNALCPVPQSSK
ncbi:hypothetical protein HN873_049940, partial [Arachis hypogaea]